MKNSNYRGDGENKAEENAHQSFSNGRTLSEDHNVKRKKPRNNSKQTAKSSQGNASKPKSPSQPQDFQQTRTTQRSVLPQKTSNQPQSRHDCGISARHDPQKPFHSSGQIDPSKSSMTSTSAMMSSSSMISNTSSKPKGSAQKTTSPALSFPNKRGPSKRAHQPSMARMIEVAKKAEARRRAENETNPTPRSEASETGSKSGKSLPNRNKNVKKTSSQGDDVKTAQVLKKAAKAARAKKDPSSKSVTLVSKSPTSRASLVRKERTRTDSGQGERVSPESVIDHSQNHPPAESPTPKTASQQIQHQDNPLEKRKRWGKFMPKDPNAKLVPADPNRHMTTRQTRELRVEQAMRRIKDSGSQERVESLETLTQERLAQTLNKMSLNNPKSPLLLVAITHPSYTFENPNTNKENNQRLEFLGDAVLDFIVGEYLYLKFPDKSEGELTKIRAAVVNESTLAQAARQIQLGNALLLGRGEQVSGGRQRPSILADALEAVIGAIYLQDGFDTARQFVLDMLVPLIEEVDQDHYGDFKTLLQEVAQRDDCSICYRILDELGPDHNKSFTAGVFVCGVLKGKGTGRTKKEAEQIAARLTLESWEVK